MRKRMRLLTCALLAVLALGVCSGALAAPTKAELHTGVLTYLGTTEEEFQEGLDGLRKALSPLLPANDGTGENDGDDLLQGFLTSLVDQRRVVHFYSSLVEMRMALKAGRIDEMALPESVGLYFVDRDPDCEILFSLNMMPSTISFGFREGDTGLQGAFNGVLAAMRKDGTLERLERQYITGLGTAEPKPAKFQSFKGAPIKVAVTGDMPPIDLFAADGRPAGYNTAVLAEIGRRLKRNIQLINVDAGGRSAALVSGRADVVFWYRSTEGPRTPGGLSSPLKGLMRDSQGIILSTPYYEWETDLIIGSVRR